MQRTERSRRFSPLLVVIALVLALLTAPVAHPAPLTIDADSQYDYAQSRLAEDAFAEAIIEFNRFIHFFPCDPLAAQMNRN